VQIKRLIGWSPIVVSADLVVGRRRLLRRPFVSLVAIVSIAISLAVVGAMVSVVSKVDFRDYPYAFADRLVAVYTRHDASSRDPGSEGPGLSYAAFLEFRRRSRSFERLEAASTLAKLPGDADAVAEIVPGHAATPGFLSMLGVQPKMGRWFLESDTASGAPPVAVLAYAYWMSKFGGDPGIIGKSLTLLDRFPPDAAPKHYQVIGVLPRTFAWDATSSYWLPLGAAEPSSLATVDVLGRLRPDVLVRSASAEAGRIAGDVRDLVEAARPPGDRSLGGSLEVRATRLADYRRGRNAGKEGRLALFALAASVLVLAVANLLMLNLLSTEARRSELAVRRALGSSRAWLIRQMVVETSLLVAPGLLLAALLSVPLVRLASEKLHTATLGVVPTLDGPTVGVMVTLAFVIAIVLGVVPVLVIMRHDLVDAIMGRATRASLAGIIMSQRAIVFVESAIAIVVMMAAGLVVKELRRLEFRELGYTPSGIVLIGAPPTRPRPTSDVKALGVDALSRVAAVAGVSRTAVLATDFTVHLRSEGMAERLAPTIPRAIFGITPNVFDILGIPLIKGRSFTNADDASHPYVTILSLEASRRLFGDANPVGRKLALTGIGPAEVEVWTTIVGVAGDAHLRDDPTAPKEAVVYRPFAQARPFVVQVVARVGKRTNAIDQELRAAVAPLAAGPRNRWAVTFLEDDVDKYLATPRFTASSVSGLAALGLFLLLVGVFGVTATSVSLRTREIAIRLAIGASSERVLWTILRETVFPVVLGFGVGLGLSLEMGGLMKSFLYGSTPFDTVLYVVTSLMLIGAVCVASMLPARRALRVDPSSALRLE